MILLDPIDVSAPGVFVRSNVPENDAPAQSLTRVYAAKDRVLDPVSHQLFESKMGVRSVVTISLAAAGVITWPAHGLVAGTAISFETTETLPGGLLPNKVYYVLAPSANSFTVSATVGGAAITTTGPQSGVHSAAAGLNFNRPLTDTTYWLPSGVSNVWKMFDDYNNTQTEYPDVIEFEVSPKAYAKGLYLGNLDATEVEVVSTDPVAGVVFSERTSLVVRSWGTSFYRWLFSRRRRSFQFLTINLPLYYYATLKVRIHNPGSIARCGRCCIGPIEEYGLTQYNIGTEIKDYSTTKFNMDGTSETTVRGFAKRMSLDVVVPNDLIEYLQDRLAAARQRTMVYIGVVDFKWTVLCGKYSSFKVVVPDVPDSKIALQIEGTV